MAALDSLRTAREVWESSRFILGNDMSAFEPVAQSGINPAVLWIFIALIVIVLIMFKRWSTGVVGSFFLLSGSKRSQELFGENYYLESSMLALIVGIPFYAFTLVYTGVSRYTLEWTFVVLVALLVFRLLAFRIAGWLSNRRNEFKMAGNYRTGIFLCILYVSLLVLLVKAFFPNMGPGTAAIMLGIAASVGIIVYFIQNYRIFISSGVSHIFWFLYLCGLEILPIGVVVKVLVF
jgi:hypothetical protein